MTTPQGLSRVSIGIGEGDGLRWGREFDEEIVLGENVKNSDGVNLYDFILSKGKDLQRRDTLETTKEKGQSVPPKEAGARLSPSGSRT